MKKASTYNIAKLSLVSCCIFFVPFLSSAQSRGAVEVIKDPLIDTLIAKRAALNKSVAAADETSNGYRVQIFFGSNRQAAYSAQEKFKEEFPQFHTYLSYTEPNFRVQVGDFRSRLDAQKLMSELAQMFTSLFIIPGKINPPKPDAPND